MQRGTITIEIDPITPQETERLRLNILTLIANGVFNLKNGKAILNYDHEGILQTISFDFLKYRRQK